VLIYFSLATAVPYAVGVQAASRLREAFIREQEQTVEDLSNLLTAPRSELYDRGLREIDRTRCERIKTLKQTYFDLDRDDLAPRCRPPSKQIGC
jgi:hypothetical protein